jgi:hypothetical protein
MVLKFFGWREILDLAAKIPQGLDEEAQEQVVAFRTVAASATSDNPPHCVICRDPTIYPSLMGYARTASKSPFRHGRLRVMLVSRKKRGRAARQHPRGARGRRTQNVELGELRRRALNARWGFLRRICGGARRAVLQRLRSGGQLR